MTLLTWMRRISRRRAAMLLLTASALLAVAAVPSSYGTLTGSVRNTSDTAASAIFTCQGVVRGANAYLAYPLTDTALLTTATDASINNRPGTYTTLGVTYGQPGPCPRDGAKSVTLDGSSGYVYGPGTAFPLNAAVTMQVWFRTSTAQGGKLIGFGNAATGSSTNYDKHLYMTNAGKVIWGVNPGPVKTVTSPNSYNNNVWHQAVGTLAPSTDPNPGMRLYIDGALVASDSTVTTSQVYNGFVRIGYDNLNGWPSQPTSAFLAGSVAWASAYTSALTPAQITGMYQVG